MTSNNTYHDDGRRTVGKQKTRQIFECLYEKKCGGSDCVHNLRAKRMQAALRANERRVAQANRARVRARGQDGAGDGDGGDPGDGDDDPVDSDNDEEDDEEEDEVDIDAEAAGDEDAAAIALGWSLQLVQRKMIVINDVDNCTKCCRKPTPRQS